MNEGIDHLTCSSKTSQDDQEIQIDSSHSSYTEGSSSLSTRVSFRERNLTMLQKLKEIHRVLQNLLETLKTGLNDKDDIFSTSARDYDRDDSSDDDLGITEEPSLS